MLAILVGGVTAARLAYFHDWAPNTFHAKPSDAAVVVANAYGFLAGENSEHRVSDHRMAGNRRVWRWATPGCGGRRRRTAAHAAGNLPLGNHLCRLQPQ